MLIIVIMPVFVLAKSGRVKETHPLTLVIYTRLILTLSDVRKLKTR